MDFLIPGTDMLGQARHGSIYDETGTPASGYGECGPYHCMDCVHKPAPNEPYCIHPRVVDDFCMQDKLVMIGGRPAIKINLEHGCCRFVRPPAEKCEDHEHGDN